MKFIELSNRIELKLEQISAKYSSYVATLDNDDLLSEMKLHLWKEWKAGKLDNATDSYVVQSCYFHLRNRMRKMRSRENAIKVSIDEPLDGEDAPFSVPLRDSITGGEPGILEITDGGMIVDKIFHNGFSRIEKEIVGMLCDGFTAREIGKRLGISHTMVMKHRDHMAVEVARKYGYLLV